LAHKGIKYIGHHLGSQIYCSLSPISALGVDVVGDDSPMRINRFAEEPEICSTRTRSPTAAPVTPPPTDSNAPQEPDTEQRPQGRGNLDRGHESSVPAQRLFWTWFVVARVFGGSHLRGPSIMVYNVDIHVFLCFFYSSCYSVLFSINCPMECRLTKTTPHLSNKARQIDRSKDLELKKHNPRYARELALGSRSSRAQFRLPSLFIAKLFCFSDIFHYFFLPVVFVPQYEAYSFDPWHHPFGSSGLVVGAV
jgi:hypothetical protein